MRIAAGGMELPVLHHYINSSVNLAGATDLQSCAVSDLSVAMFSH